MLKSTSIEESKSEETTIISNGVKIDGKLTSSGNIRVEGEIQGDISSQRNVVVGERGKVNGQINADTITIGGKVSGTAQWPCTPRAMPSTCPSSWFRTGKRLRLPQPP